MGFYRDQSRHPVSRRNAESGNMFLELILYLPIIVILMVVLVETALHFLEVNRVRDTINSQLHAEGAVSLKRHVLKPYSNGVDMRALSVYSDELAAKVQQHIEGWKTTYRKGQQARYAVQISMLRVQINPVDGRVDATRPYEVLYSSFLPKRGLASASDSAAYYVTMEDFIREQLEQGSGGIDAHGYAELLHGVDVQGNLATRYRDSSYVLYVEVRTLASGRARAYIKNLFGSYFVVQEQQLFPIRRL